MFRKMFLKPLGNFPCNLTTVQWIGRKSLFYNLPDKLLRLTEESLPGLEDCEMLYFSRLTLS